MPGLRHSHARATPVVTARRVAPVHCWPGAPSGPLHAALQPDSKLTRNAQVVNGKLALTLIVVD